MQSRELETPSTVQQLTTGDKDLVNWFFLRLQTSYLSKFQAQFADDKALFLAKKEWAKQILLYTREELHVAIEKAKEERKAGNKDFDWPDIPRILGLLESKISPNGHNSAAYLSFDDARHPRNLKRLPDGRINPEYVEPVLGIESDSHKEKHLRAGNTALKEMMKDLK